ncbi:MAG: GNAT family N-acetyltransferase [Proteobacteria bacterium]|nr:GNAT family N-acetyltransferase [Pseudomonadota bacterium]
MPTVRMLRADEDALLACAVPDVFDHAVRPDLVREFLSDPRHHIAVALEGEAIVGFVSAVHYVHPDKPAELWINEVGVASSHRKRGLAKEMMQTMLVHGRALGCEVAWVLTDTENAAARTLYASVGGEELSQNTVHVEFKLM